MAQQTWQLNFDWKCQDKRCLRVQLSFRGKPELPSTSIEKNLHIFSKENLSCYYNADLEQEKYWTVSTVDFCNSTLDAYLANSTHQFQVKASEVTSMTARVVRVLSTETDKSMFFNNKADDTQFANPKLYPTKFKPVLRRRKVTSGRVELLLVADKTAVEILQENISFSHYTGKVFNHVNSYWKKFNFNLTLSEVELPEILPKFARKARIQEILDAFIYYKPASGFRPDVKLYLTGREFNDVRGLAHLGTICWDGLSSGVIVVSPSIRTTGIAIAHEIGHIFGFIHTEQHKKSCSCGENTCIMNGVLSSLANAFDWSNCDQEALRAIIEEGRLSCIDDDDVKASFNDGRNSERPDRHKKSSGYEKAGKIGLILVILALVCGLALHHINTQRYQ